MANPNVRPHLSFYPEDNGPKVSEARQGERRLKKSFQMTRPVEITVLEEMALILRIGNTKPLTIFPLQAYHLVVIRNVGKPVVGALSRLMRLEWHESELDARFYGTNHTVRLREIISQAPHLRYLFLSSNPASCFLSSHVLDYARRNVWIHLNTSSALPHVT
ncbi:hypothetical protein B0H14DRAFT_2585413 [Mycena olivaceomarginata]|nr:hypothetical protein B0H14DRAFT_2585413 [Mycena olivaceomarginata]